MRIWILSVLCCLAGLKLSAQSFTNERNVTFLPGKEEIKLDSLSTQPNSFFLFFADGSPVADSLFVFNELFSTFTWKGPEITDSLVANFKVFYFRLPTSITKMKEQQVDTIDGRLFNAFKVEPERKSTQLVDFQGLQSSGSLSRGISLGNNQNVVVNSGLNLQLTGNLGNDLTLEANITDNTVPFQPEGVTQQLQDFDRVFFKISNPNNSVILGDFDLLQQDAYFNRYFKNAKGLSIENAFKIKEDVEIKSKVSATSARGRFGRNVFQGREGNQGPYRLVGTQNESFIVVLANSERVYFDGILLKRGEQYDYIIDYNTADLVFTPNRIITNQSRIIVEFEYANQVFVRGILAVDVAAKIKDLELYVNHYTESDLRNQPIQQSLNENQRRFLSEAGNDFATEVFLPSAEAVEYSPEQLLYKRIDTLGFSNVYVFSANPDSAQFRVTFSFVGQGNGDYQPAQNNSNGRVFSWIPPEIVGNDTVRRGSYAPLLRLVPPSKVQLTSVGTRYKISEKLRVSTELARSVADNNLFSEASSPEKNAYALRAALNFQDSLNIPKLGKGLFAAELNTEQLENGFRVIQPYRNMEFARDWNLDSIYSFNRESLSGFNASWRKSTKQYFGVKIQHFGVANFGNSIRYRAEAGWSWKQSDVLGFRDVARFENRGTFARDLLQYNLRSKFFHYRLRLEQENNQISDFQADTLTRNSFRFLIADALISTLPDKPRKASFNYIYRGDYLPIGNNLVFNQNGHIFNGLMDFTGLENHQTRVNAQYRIADIVSGPTQGREQSILGQFEYNGAFFDRFITASSFVSASSGQELKRNFAFLEVPAGQGNYVWNDYNNNGIQELDEFEISFFSDQANFIKVFIPGNEFVPTFSTQFNQTINTNFSKLIDKSKKGKWANLGRKFSHLSILSLDNKAETDASLKYLNPFNDFLVDTSLLASNTVFRNSFFYNRSGTGFGIDLNLSKGFSKLLLTNGFDEKGFSETAVRIRNKISKSFTTDLLLKEGVRDLLASYSLNRNYRIVFKEIEPKLNFVPNSNLRFSLSYNYGTKINTLSEGIDGAVERATVQKGILEANINQIKESSLRLQYSLVSINFNGLPNSPASFEMLQGLATGTNQLWNLTLFKKLANNLQLNFSYEGRKLPQIPTVHVGRVQARIVF